MNWKRLTSWISPAYDGSRRRVLVGATVILAAPVLIKVAKLLPPLEAARATALNGMYAELTAITRKAFMPRVFVQIYQASPLLAALMTDASGNPITVKYEGEF